MILFKDALKVTMGILEKESSKEIVFQFLNVKLISHFKCEYIESERLINLMVQHGYLERKDSFYTIFISPTDKTYDYFNIDKYSFDKWLLN
jgi:hypothetical protein